MTGVERWTLNVGRWTLNGTEEERPPKWPAFAIGTVRRPTFNVQRLAPSPPFSSTSPRPRPYSARMHVTELSSIFYRPTRRPASPHT
mgnify:CR=1 FL=1